MIKYQFIIKWRLLGAILFLLILHIPVCAKEAAALVNKKKINLLVIHSFDKDMPDYPYFNELIEKDLKSREISADINFFYLDCDLYGHDEEIEQINNFLDTIFTKPDIIVTVDDQATYSTLSSRNPILETIPILFSGVNFPNWDLLNEYPNVTGLWDNPDYENNVKMIEDLLGEKRIRFFYDRTYNGKRVLERLAEQYKDKDVELYNSLFGFLENNVSIENDEKIVNGYLKGTDYGERPIETTLQFINMRDDLGRNLLWNISGSFRYSVFLLTKYDYTIAKVGRLATVPTFSAVNKGFTYNTDILGGYFTTIEDQVTETGDYFSRIVHGDSISQLPVKESSKKYVIDWDVLNRWNIPVEDVPGYVEIINIPIYVKYKTAAIIFFSLLTLFTLSIITYLLFLYRRESKRKRQAQINLWEEKEFLALALEGGNIFVWKYDNVKEEFIFDKEFLDSVGYSFETIKLEDLLKKTHPDEVESTLNNFVRVLSGIDSRGNIRVRLNFNGEDYVWYEFRFLNVSSVLGSKSATIGLVMNIQEYKNKEQELTVAWDLASKAELKQSFLANMSHEIRTPLNAIVGFSNILVECEEDISNENKLEYIHIINKNSELLLKLINDILEISRIESNNMSFVFELCDLNDLIDDIYGTCILQTPPNVELVKITSNSELVINTDIMRLKQVLVNFVNNAFKFTTSGSVTIGIDNNKEKKEICIYVADTGTGIPEKQQKMIFERFYKVNEFVQGTGLGLSICQVIAERLNGRLSLISKEGEGSRFEIILPYSEEDCDNEDEEENKERENRLLSGEKGNEIDENLPTILVAEDSVNNYILLNNILKKRCNVIWAINGKDALNIVKTQKIDLVLMDIKMHEMDGITALTKIRRKFKNLPVIIQTAYAFEENIKLAKQAEASGFITKPIKQEVILSEIRRFIDIG